MNEKAIQETLDKFSEGKTTIVIAHRLSTIKDVDHIYVINHGEMIEQGTHKELVEKHGFYYKLQKT